ncbi:MAG: amidase [Gemmatimonadetes bacterium]|nr:MAG: amidase [Gemmatimonadota bacterium]
MRDDVAFGSIPELGRLLRARKLSSTDLTELYLERLERFGPRYNCVVTVTPERALAEAATADRELRAGRVRGPLHGIPYGVKDLLAAKGYPTTWGAEPYRSQSFDEDATVVARLGAAGAVLVAKLAMVELAGGMGYSQANASFTGPGKTPWSVDYWSGGSSSGPGSAVAAGLVPFAIGSETSGSILTPAAYCGITGLRPTYGLVSRHGAMALSWTMDKLGPMARSAEDCALVLAAIAGRDPLDASSVPRGFRMPAPEPRARRFRIGVPKGVIDAVQGEVAENFTIALDVLRSVAEIVPDVELPDLPFGVVGGVIIAAEGLSAFDDLVEGNRLKDLTAPEDRTGGYGALAISARDYLRALRVRRLMGRAYDELLKPFDAIATPTRTTVASPLDKAFRDAYPEVRGGVSMIGASNVVGVPAISVPNGFGPGGLPTGLSLVARAFDEAKLVRIARAYQARTDWHKRRPEVV